METSCSTVLTVIATTTVMLMVPCIGPVVMLRIIVLWVKRVMTTSTNSSTSNHTRGGLKGVAAAYLVPTVWLSASDLRLWLILLSCLEWLEFADVEHPITNVRRIRSAILGRRCETEALLYSCHSIVLHDDVSIVEDELVTIHDCLVRTDLRGGHLGSTALTHIVGGGGLLLLSRLGAVVGMDLMRMMMVVMVTVMVRGPSTIA